MARETRTGMITVDLATLSPEIHDALARIREVAYADGIFPSRVKVLTALAISTVIKCEPCVRMYVEKAIELGVTREEMIEMLNVAMAMGGCPGEAWVHKALLLYESQARNRPVAVTSDGGACCA
jgi:AhpD family alkylhydroperoxidase